MTTILQERSIHKTGDERGTYIEDKGCHAYREDCAHNLGTKPKARALESQEALGRRVVAHLNKQTYALRNNRSPCRALDAPLKDKDKERIKDGAKGYGCEHYIHRLAGITRGTELLIKTEIEVGNDITKHDNTHKPTCEIECLDTGITS